MIDRDTLLAYLDDALDPETRERVEAELAHDPEARRFVAEQRKMDRLLRSALRPATQKHRIKQSILAAVRASAPEEIKARVIETTGATRVSPTDRLGVRAWAQVRGFTASTVQRFNALTLQWRLAYIAGTAAIVILALSTWFYFRPAPSSRIAVGQFAAVVGQPTVQRIGARSPLPAPRSVPVFLGDRIETHDADKAEIQFNDGTTLRLNFNTTLEIPKPEIRNPKSRGSTLQPFDPLTLQRPPEVRLIAGHVWAKVQKTTNAPHFAVKTRVATAAVKGTEFGLKLNHGRLSTLNLQPSTLSAVLSVKEGAVEFSNALGSVQATAMTESTARADAPPTEPKRLQTLQVMRSGNSMEWSILTSQLDWPDAAVQMALGGGWVGVKARNFPTTAPTPVIGSNEVRIVHVAPDSPAATAGLRVDDVLVSLDGEPLLEASQISLAFLTQPDVPVAMVLRRGGGELTVHLSPKNRPSLLPGPALSPSEQVQLRDLTRSFIEPGVRTNDHTIAPLRDVRLQAAAENNLGVIQEADDVLGPAIRTYGRAVRAAPNVALYRYNLGLALRKIGSFERAAEELEKAVELFPGSVEARKRLAEIHSLLGNESEALAQTEATLQAAPQDHGLWELKSRILTKQGQDAAATEAARKAVETGPGCPVALAFLAGALLNQRDLAGAEEFYRKALELAPYEPTLHVNLGIVLKDKGDLKAAEQRFRRAIELQPDFELAWNNLGGLGTTLAQRRDFTAAERLLRLVCDFNPDSSAIHNNLGEVLRAQGKMDEAIPYFRKAIQLDPNNSGPYNNLGIIHAMRKEFAEAERLFRSVIERAPNEVSTPTYVNLATVLGEQGKVAEAEPMFRKALAVNPDDPNVCNALAFFLADHQLKLDEALELARRAVQAVPRNPEFLDTLGWVLLQRGELDEAERTFQQALGLAGENPPANEIREHLKKLEQKRNQPK